MAAGPRCAGFVNECNLVLGNEVNLQWGALWCKEWAGLFFWWGQTDLAVWDKHGKYPRVPKYNLLRPSCMAFALLDGWVWGPIIQGPLIANTRLYLVLIEWIEELNQKEAQGLETEEETASGGTFMSAVKSSGFGALYYGGVALKHDHTARMAHGQSRTSDHCFY